MITPEQLARLPKYARDRITQLERNLAYAQAKLATGPEDSNTFADPYYGTVPRPLGQDSTIEFRLDSYDDKRHHDQVIQARVDRSRHPEPHSYLYVNGGDSLLVEPQSSNVVRIRLARDPR